ncbi:MAG: TIGR03862 family flavoprotein [Hyphomonadaceae bacterium]
MSSAQRRAIIVGAGPAGLAAAELLASEGWVVTIHERMPNPARKFLLAGRGGLNLTHSEPLDAFLTRYGDARSRLEPTIAAFTPADLRAWCEGLGIETFVGSSGRVFPKQMKASPLLRAWLARLGALGVTLAPRSHWMGWQGDALVFDTPDGERIEQADATVFALGGASWPRLGSDGAWQAAFAERGARITPLRPANSGFVVGWSSVFRDRFAGEPIKRAGFSFAGNRVRGEAIISRYGIEGGAIYALGGPVRTAIEANGEAIIAIDLMPDLSVDAIASRLTTERKDSTPNRLRKAGLSPAAASLLREDVRGSALPATPQEMAERIKDLRIRLGGVAAIDRAISTAGGITWDSLNADFSLKADPRTFIAGEMLDWEAPTGGYLLQACFATGRAAAHGVLARS